MPAGLEISKITSNNDEMNVSLRDASGNDQCIFIFREAGKWCVMMWLKRYPLKVQFCAACYAEKCMGL